MKMGARSWSTTSASPPSGSSGSTATTTVAESSSGPLFSPSSSSSSSSSSANVAGCHHCTTQKHHHHRGAGRQQPTPAQVGESSALAVATALQRAERSRSVRRDLALDLPTCLALPDGEERPYGSSSRIRLRDHEQESEIYRECIRPPPNRTVHDSYLPFRCNSEGILSSATKASAVGPSSSCSVGAVATSGKGSRTKSSSSSPSSILAVCCAAASSTSLSSDSGSHHHYHHHHHHLHHQQGDELSRLLLDMHGQPIVTRSKSMSTGSSYVSPAPISSSSRLEATVKSCVRSLKERLGVDQSPPPSSDAVRRRPSSADQLQTTAEEDCCCHTTTTTTSSSQLLASVPVLSCDSSSTCSSS